MTIQLRGNEFYDLFWINFCFNTHNFLFEERGWKRDWGNEFGMFLNTKVLKCIWDLEKWIIISFGFVIMTINGSVSKLRCEVGRYAQGSSFWVEERVGWILVSIDLHSSDMTLFWSVDVNLDESAHGTTTTSVGDRKSDDANGSDEHCRCKNVWLEDGWLGTFDLSVLDELVVTVEWSWLVDDWFNVNTELLDVLL